jgi:hypothetical protein
MSPQSNVIDLDKIRYFPDRVGANERLRVVKLDRGDASPGLSGESSIVNRSDVIGVDAGGDTACVVVTLRPGASAKPVGNSTGWVGRAYECDPGDPFVSQIPPPEYAVAVWGLGSQAPEKVDIPGGEDLWWDHGEV